MLSSLRGLNQVPLLQEFETLEQSIMVEIIRRRQMPSAKPSNDVAPMVVDGPTLQDDMKAFLESGIGSEFCDVTLVCQDVAIPVHKVWRFRPEIHGTYRKFVIFFKVILAARSAYFEAMFRSWMPETNTVQITLGELQLSPQAFRSLLRYIYYGCVDMPPEDSLYLFGAPAYYGFSNNRIEVSDLPSFARLSLSVRRFLGVLQGEPGNQHQNGECARDFGSCRYYPGERNEEARFAHHRGALLESRPPAETASLEQTATSRYYRRCSSVFVNRRPGCSSSRFSIRLKEAEDEWMLRAAEAV